MGRPEFEVSAYIADIIVERRTDAYRVWRKHRAELGDANDFLAAQTGTIRSIAAELLAQPLDWARDEEGAREELLKLVGR